MRKIVIHINKLFCLILLLLISSCERDINISEQQGGGEDMDEKVQIEIFTRAASYDLPSTRAAESDVSMTPWVLVFKGEGGSATFVEAVQAFEMAGKRYVILTKQSSKCQFLVLANTQDEFYFENNTAVNVFNEMNLNEKLNGMTLANACAKLLTKPLSGSPLTVIPYSGVSERIPMSAVLEVNKIDNDTKIQNSDPAKGALLLNRAIARIAVVNTASNFELHGITALFNVPRQGQLHHYSGSSIMNNTSNLTEYQGDSDYLSPLVTASAVTGGQSTDSSPIYIYESGTLNNTYMIIRGKYDSKYYYYKMAIVDKSLNTMDLLRNKSYTFTITKAKGPGYEKIGDAKAAKPSNVDLDFKITVDDSDSYEIIANNDYYLGVSNSVFIVYTNEDKDHDEAFNLITDCETVFPNTRNITDNRGDADGAFNLFSPADGKIPIVTGGSTSPRITPIGVRILNWLMYYEEGQGDKVNTFVTLKLGNLEKKVQIRQRYAIGASGTVLEYRPTDSYPYPGTYPNLMDYHCLTGQVEDGDDNATDWIKLRPSTMAQRDDTERIIVEDGAIFIEVLANTGRERRGIVYLTTVESQGASTGESRVKRVKIDITQTGNQN